MNKIEIPPRADEFELTVFGPGYGECIVVHTGEGSWIVIDSCVDKKGNPLAISYLKGVGVDLAKDVKLIVATHWHDDHIRGISKLVNSCSKASFSCAAVLLEKEFLAATEKMENENPSVSGSGAREIYHTFAHFEESRGSPIFALARLLILERKECKVWALSPSHNDFRRFLDKIRAMVPQNNQLKNRRFTSLSPNDVSVVLRIEVRDFVVLLGADLETKGWRRILESNTPYPKKASVFKVPHHGGESADHPHVWEYLLTTKPIAIIAPWSRGGKFLPTPDDAERILTYAQDAYVTARPKTDPTPKRDKRVERGIREVGAQLRAITPSSGTVRLRCTIGKDQEWTVEKFGSACGLSECHVSAERVSPDNL